MRDPPKSEFNTYILKEKGGLSTESPLKTVKKPGVHADQFDNKTRISYQNIITMWSGIMFGVYVFGVVIACSLIHLVVKWDWHWPRICEVFLSYILLFNVGLMGLLAAFSHIFFGPETAKLIGWEPGSPFQFEIGVADLSYGVLGVLAYWIRGNFWTATIIGWSVLMIGCFAGHLMDYILHGNDASYNIGIFIWIYDFILPFIALGLLKASRQETV